MEQMRINVPEGCTAEIKQENGLLIVSFEQKEKEKSEEWEPKDGDICVSNRDTIFIFNGNGKYKTSIHVALLKKGNVTYGGALNGNDSEGYRYATDSEKQRLFDALTKAGKRWNAEKKCIEDLPRWRQKHDECYYFIDSELNVSYQPDVRCKTDNNRHEAGNYFKTKEAAERVASQIREILKKSKAE